MLKLWKPTVFQKETGSFYGERAHKTDAAIQKVAPGHRDWGRGAFLLAGSLGDRREASTRFGCFADAT